MVRQRALLGFAAPLLLGLSCSQIVGITDTQVTQGGAGTPAAGGGGSAGQVSSSGSSNGGRLNMGGDGASQAGALSGGGTSAGSLAAGGTDAGGQGGDGDGGTPPLPGPTLIETGSYAVDSTEVTVAQYKEFLEAKAGDVTGQPTVCAWNESYYDMASMPLEQNTWPIANVDWCDATAYCSWAGKRLCGAISGGSIGFEGFSDPAQSQWFRACGGPLGQPHPNSDWMCNDNGGFDDVAPVASFPGCEGFYPGLFDLQANVAEWVDSCDGSSGEEDHCILAGGSALDQDSYCNETFTDVKRSDTSPYFGFRCCSK
jgi:hypothetical protein